MCGFVAVYNPQGGKVIPQDTIRKMCDVVIHRGPDAGDFYEDEHVLFGHRRLSIIDLSDQANQPMVKGDFVIVYNGEIYNYLELRKDLETHHGVRFNTHSDTEVIIEAYASWGMDCLEKFNGMFAFALWDRKKELLFLARDRLGVKPLFWAKERGAFYFASDIKSLWEIMPPSGRLNTKAINNYFFQGYVSVPETSTEGIYKFPPAHYRVIGADRDEMKMYWDLNETAKANNVSFEETAEQTESLLRDAVKLRLRSDVPLGCFLSGGVDSSLVTAFASAELNASFHTYSIGFDSPDYDESPYARKVSSRYSTQHHHVLLDSSCMETLPKIIWDYSELFGDSSALPAYFVSKAAVENLKVVLTGDGGDEGFGGYMDPFAVYMRAKYRLVPAGMRKVLGGVLARGDNSRSHYLIRWLKRFNDISFLSIDELYMSLRDGSWSMYADAVRHQGGELRPLFLQRATACQSHDEVDKLLYTDIYDRLCHDFLVKMDMATMAHSLEARSPFLDYRLIELGYALSHHTRYKGYKSKAVLKKVAEKYIDREIIHRKKMGFSIPQEKWLSSEKMFSNVCQIISRRTCLDDYIRRDYVNQILHDFKKGQPGHANRIWLLLWFQVWEGLFVSRIYRPGQRLSELAA